MSTPGNTDPYYVVPTPQQNAVGLVGFIVSMLGVVTCGLLCPLGLLISVCGLGKAPRGFATAGTITGLLGSAWLVLVGYALVSGLFVAKDFVETNLPMVTTVATFQQGDALVRQYQRDHDKIPDSIEGNVLIDSLRDGWERSILYAINDDGSYVFRSAGADGEFHSEDDLTSDMKRLPTQSKSFDPMINEGGITIEDGDRKLEISTGEIRVGDGQAEVGGGSLNIQDGDRKVRIELPSVRSNTDESE